MAIALTAIFGSAIKVYSTALQFDHQETGYPGAHGITDMNLGSRGRHLFVRGTLKAAGGTYAKNRGAVSTAIAAIETWLWSPANTFTFFNDVYYNVIFIKFEPIPDNEGKLFHLNSNGSVSVEFLATGRQLI